METVYIVLIVAVTLVILVTIVLLRNRITKAKLDISLTERRGSAELSATSPKEGTTENRPIARSGFVGNIAEWWSHIRAPEGARVVNNRASVGSSIEVVERKSETVTEKKPDSTDPQ